MRDCALSQRTISTKLYQLPPGTETTERETMNPASTNIQSTIPCNHDSASQASAPFRQTASGCERSRPSLPVAKVNNSQNDQSASTRIRSFTAPRTTDSLTQASPSLVSRDLRPGNKSEKALAAKTIPLAGGRMPVSVAPRDPSREKAITKAAQYLACRAIELDNHLDQGSLAGSCPLKPDCPAEKRAIKRALRAFWEEAVLELGSLIEKRGIDIDYHPHSSFLDLDLAWHTPQNFFCKMQELQEECWKNVDWNSRKDLNNFNDVALAVGHFLLKKAFDTDCWPAAFKILKGALLAKKAGTFFQDDLVDADGFSLLHNKAFWEKASPAWYRLILAPAVLDVNRMRISDEMIKDLMYVPSGPSPLFAACHSAPQIDAIKALMAYGASPHYWKKARTAAGLSADTLEAVENRVHHLSSALARGPLNRQDFKMADEIYTLLSRVAVKQVAPMAAPWRTDWSGVRAASNARC